MERQGDNLVMYREEDGLMTWQEDNLVLKMADGEPAIKVENMFREAALEGAGIALDEFNDDGLLNRKRFHDSITLAAFSVDESSLLGGVILGTNSMNVNTSHIYLCLYIVVDVRYRRRGYGSAIYKLCEKLGQSWGFKHILTDVFTHDLAGLRLATSHNVLPTGHIPCVGWVKGRGYMTTAILHKRI